MYRTCNKNLKRTILKSSVILFVSVWPFNITFPPSLQHYIMYIAYFELISPRFAKIIVRSPALIYGQRYSSGSGKNKEKSYGILSVMYFKYKFRTKCTRVWRAIHWKAQNKWKLLIFLWVLSHINKHFASLKISQMNTAIENNHFVCDLRRTYTIRIHIIQKKCCALALEPTFERQLQLIYIWINCI